jgi:hypothetical protein
MIDFTGTAEEVIRAKVRGLADVERGASRRAIAVTATLTLYFAEYLTAYGMHR